MIRVMRTYGFLGLILLIGCNPSAISITPPVAIAVASPTAVHSTPTLSSTQITNTIPVATAPSTATLFPATPESTLSLDLLTMLSRNPDGVQGNNNSEAPALSANGRFLAFVSRASNLVPGDRDDDCMDNSYDPPQYSCSDVFVRDLQTGAIDRVSVATDGTPGNAESGIRYEQGSLVSISGDGRFVAFQSFASNLVPGCMGVYVHDRQTGNTTCAAIASDGKMGSGISGWPIISENGRFVAFISEADNLVPNDANGWADVFVHDLQTGQTERVSVASDGTEANNLSGDLGGYPSLSADGRFVAFASYAGNLVNQDTNNQADIFVHDRQTGMIQRISVGYDGAEANGSSSFPNLSADGRFIVFQSEASNLVAGDTNQVVDLFVYDQQTGQTERVNVTSDGTQAMRGNSTGAVFGANGRLVAFTSEATNLVPNDTNQMGDIFVYERDTKQTMRISVTNDGQEANGESNFPALAAEGHLIAFWSLADNLTDDDDNQRGDILLWTLTFTGE